MNPFYQMVIVNVVLCSILLLGTLFYRYIYPKKQINLFFLLIAISVIPTVSIFRTGSYQFSDLNQHLVDIISYFNVLTKEHTLPRWGAELSAGFGEPQFIFEYQLPYLFASLLHLLGFSFLNSGKIVLASSFVVSGITMYLWAKEELNSKKFGFVAAICYLFFPYHLVDLHFRAAIAETLSFVFMPLLLYFTKKFINERKRIYFPLLSVTVFLLIICHQAIALIFLPFLVAYFFFSIKKKDLILIFDYFLALFFGILITSFYWFPILFELKYISTSDMPLLTPIRTLLFSPFGYGFLFRGQTSEISVLLGYTQIVVIVTAIILIWHRRADHSVLKNILFYLLIIFISLFMINTHSKFIWQFAPFIKSILFAWRILAVVAVFLSLLSGYVLKIINKNLFTVIFVLISIGYTILNWGNGSMVKIDDNTLTSMLNSVPNKFNLPMWVNGVMIKTDSNTLKVNLNSVQNKANFLGPMSPKWAFQNYKKLPLYAKNIELITGKATINSLKRTPYHHFYTIEVYKKSEFLDRTIFYPGWTLYVDGKKQKINYVNPRYPGIITFQLNEGKHEVELAFEDTWDRTISYWISLVSFFILIFYTLFSKKLYFKG